MSQLQFPPRSLEPPNLNLPSQGDDSRKDYEDSALPSSEQEFATKSSEKQTDEHHDVSHDGGHVVDNYPVTTVDFSRVETPFIIGVWILFASVAKIGEYTQSSATMVAQKLKSH